MVKLGGYKSICYEVPSLGTYWSVLGSSVVVWPLTNTWAALELQKKGCSNYLNQAQCNQYGLHNQCSLIWLGLTTYEGSSYIICGLFSQVELDKPSTLLHPLVLGWLSSALTSHHCFLFCCLQSPSSLILELPQL